MTATTELPPEIWSQILHICVVELTATDSELWHCGEGDFPPNGQVTLRKAAAALVRVCGTWRDLILSDPHFKVLRIELSKDRKDISHTDLDVDDVVLVALRTIYPAEAAGQRAVRHQILRFAARLQALSIIIYNITDVIAAFQAIEEVSFEHLEFLEMVSVHRSAYFNLSPSHLSQIRAPLLTNLRFKRVDIFEHETKDLRSFLRFIQGLNYLLDLDLEGFNPSYSDVFQLSRRDPPDLLRSQVVPLTTLTLCDDTTHIIVLLRYLTLPNLKTLKLCIQDWQDAVPNEGWYSPGFAFPKLSVIMIGRVNLGIARFLSYSLLPELKRVIIGSTSPVRGHYYPIRMPKVVFLTWNLSGCSGAIPFSEFWSKCSTASLTSLFLELGAGDPPSNPSILDRFDSGSPAFKNVRLLAIAISHAKKFLNTGKKLDLIFGHLSAVEDLQLFFYPKDSTRLKFPIPSASRKGDGYKKYEDILPDLQSLSLFIPDYGIGLSIPMIMKCANVESYVKQRSSSGKRLVRLVFNRPVAQKALVRLEKYVDRVVIQRKGWERVNEMTGQRTWPFGSI